MPVRRWVDTGSLAHRLTGSPAHWRTASRPQERPPIHHQRLPGEIATGVRAQEQHDWRDVVLGVAEAVDAAVPDEGAALRGGALDALFAALGGGAGAEAVDDDAVRAPLARRRAGERADCLLRHGVGAV